MYHTPLGIQQVSNHGDLMPISGLAAPHSDPISIEGSWDTYMCCQKVVRLVRQFKILEETKLKIRVISTLWTRLCTALISRSPIIPLWDTNQTNCIANHTLKFSSLSSPAIIIPLSSRPFHFYKIHLSWQSFETIVWLSGLKSLLTQKRNISWSEISCLVNRWRNWGFSLQHRPWSHKPYEGDHIINNTSSVSRPRQEKAQPFYKVQNWLYLRKAQFFIMYAMKPLSMSFAVFLTLARTKYVQSFLTAFTWLGMGRRYISLLPWLTFVNVTEISSCDENASSTAKVILFEHFCEGII